MGTKSFSQMVQKTIISRKERGLEYWRAPEPLQVLLFLFCYDIPKTAA